METIPLTPELQTALEKLKRGAEGIVPENGLETKAA